MNLLLGRLWYVFQRYERRIQAPQSSEGGWVVRKGVSSGVSPTDLQTQFQDFELHRYRLGSRSFNFANTC